MEAELLRRSRARYECLNIGFQVKEIDVRVRFFRDAPLLGQARPRGDARQGVDLARAAAILRLEARAVLEEADAILLAALVQQHVVQEAGPERDAHDGEVCGNRVREQQTRAIGEQTLLVRRICHSRCLVSAQFA